MNHTHKNQLQKHFSVFGIVLDYLYPLGTCDAVCVHLYTLKRCILHLYEYTRFFGSFYEVVLYCFIRNVRGLFNYDLIETLDICIFVDGESGFEREHEIQVKRQQQKKSVFNKTKYSI